LEESSQFFHVSKPKVEKAMFSDLWAEQVLSEFNSLSPDELIRRLGGIISIFSGKSNTWG
jgi:predicted nuclease of restriction endonuclease-like RecB superfamily